MPCCIPECPNDADITIGGHRYCSDCRRLLALVAHRIIVDLHHDIADHRRKDAA
jgi:hypothetical protein